MIRKLVYLIVISISANSCGTSKRTVNNPSRKVTVVATTEKDVSAKEDNTIDNIPPIPIHSKATNIVTTALSYAGTPYKYGGTSKKGMDCSGLLHTAFAAHNFSLPRVSYIMAEEGKRIPIKKVNKGDLLFFKTRKGKKINHVGLVVTVEENTIKFIHATSSRGVIVSSLREGYWNYAFVKATRVLN